MNAQAFAADPIVNALTVDVEDYFQVSAFAAHIPRSTWDSQPCRVEANIDRILGLLAESKVSATFFTLGWIAERYPALVRRLVDGGHELASHGYEHLRANEQGYGAFLADIRLAKAVLEDIAGREVKGYRAPSFSIGPANFWAFDCIADAGYRYSSSVYPIRHDHYGAPDAPRFPYKVRENLLEVPVATVRMLNSNWPAGGGGYFRLLPYGVSKWSIRPRQRHRPTAGDVLFSSVGARPDAAARQGARRQGALSPLSEPRPHRAALEESPRRFPLGPRRSRLPERRRMMESAASEIVRIGRAADRVSVRPFAAADAAAWEAFVQRCPEATFFHRIGWRDIIEDVFRHRTHYLVAERPGAIAGVLPLAEVKSRLFGHALVSLPFGVYGGPAATDAEGRARADRSGLGARRFARRRASRIPQLRGQVSGLAATGSVRAVSQDAARRPGGQPAGGAAQAARDDTQGHPQRTEERDRSIGRPLFRAVR